MLDVEKEAQKVLEEIEKRAEEFQAGKMYTPESSFSYFSNSNLKLILTVAGVIVVLIISVFFYIKSNGQKIQIKAPPGYEIIYPQNGPPRLQPKS